MVWSTKAKSVEFMMPMEEGIQAAFECKKDKYSKLVTECREARWRTTIYLVEVGCRGFMGLSTIHFLK